MNPLNNIIKELEVLGQKEVVNEIKAVMINEVRNSIMGSQITDIIEQVEGLASSLRTYLKEEKTYNEQERTNIKIWLDQLEAKMSSIYATD